MISKIEKQIKIHRRNIEKSLFNLSLDCLRSQAFSVFLWRKQIISFEIKEKYIQLESDENYIQYDEEKNILKLENKTGLAIDESKIDLKVKIDSPLDRIPISLEENLSQNTASEFINFAFKQINKFGEETGKSIYEILKTFFIISFFSAFIHSDKLTELILSSVKGHNFELFGSEIFFKEFFYTVNKKFCNTATISVNDVFKNKKDLKSHIFNCLNKNEKRNKPKLKKYLNELYYEKEPSKEERKKSIEAFGNVLSAFAEMSDLPDSRWWQGNSENLKGDFISENQKSYKLDKENRILVISEADWKSFSANLLNKFKAQFNRVIYLIDMPGGHALIFDKRMFSCITHYSEGNKWLIFALFKKFAGIRIQMVDFTGVPINLKNIPFKEKELIKLMHEKWSIENFSWVLKGVFLSIVANLMTELIKSGVLDQLF